MAPYKYTPLDPEANTIRLMSLLPGSYHEDICVSMRTAIMTSDQIPKYEALSYAWGPAEDPINICIAARQVYRVRSNKSKISASGHLAVRQDLAIALRHLRLRNKPRVLWIDAICVDQRDLKERGHQVERMADIYRHATQVLIWLGPAHHDTALAMETIRSLGSRIEVDWLTFAIKPRSHEDAHWANGDIALPYDDETWKSIYDFISRPWFKRLWIWQEVILAKRAEIHCGYETLDWGVVSTALYCIDCKWTISILPEEIVTDFNIRLFHTTQMFKYQTVTGNILIGMLDETRDCECSDPKDRIYALLNLVHSFEPITSLKPNYSQTWQDVFREAVLHCLSKNGDLDLITYCEWRGDSPEKPTWVPDLSKPRACNPLRNPRACLGSKAVAEDVGNGILKVTGLLGSAKISSIDRSMLDEEEFTPPYSHVTGCIQRLAKNVSLDVPYIDGTEMIEALCRTLCTNLFAESYVPALSAARPNTQTSLKYVRSVLESPLEQIKPYKLYLNQAWDAMKGRSFFTTEEGYIGLGPMGVKEGDQVCVILGCKSPMLLRDNQNGRYAVIGECYVHGLMDGEALFGPLPGHWQSASITYSDAADGRQFSGFVNHKTGKTSFEDIRMGPLPSGWRLDDEEKEASPDNLFVNDESGERRFYLIDPRKTAETLRDRGVPLQEILLE